MEALRAGRDLSAVPGISYRASDDQVVHTADRPRIVDIDNIGYPAWEYDPDFDIRRHIFAAHLDAPGGEAELEALAACGWPTSTSGAPISKTSF